MLNEICRRIINFNSEFEDAIIDPKLTIAKTNLNEIKGQSEALLFKNGLLMSSNCEHAIDMENVIDSSGLKIFLEIDNGEKFKKALIQITESDSSLIELTIDSLYYTFMNIYDLKSENYDRAYYFFYIFDLLEDKAKNYSLDENSEVQLEILSDIYLAYQNKYVLEFLFCLKEMYISKYSNPNDLVTICWVDYDLENFKENWDSLLEYNSLLFIERRTIPLAIKLVESCKLSIYESLIVLNKRPISDSEEKLVALYVYLDKFIELNSSILTT